MNLSRQLIWRMIVLKVSAGFYELKIKRLEIVCRLSRVVALQFVRTKKRDFSVLRLAFEQQRCIL